MTECGDEVRFVPGDERLARILADPERRARVDAITAEMDLIDQRYRTAAQLLDDAVSAAAAEVGVTLTFGDHDVTVPWSRFAGHRLPDNDD